MNATPQADELNAITEQIIGAAMEVHRVIGPGLLESAYEACLAFELRGRDFMVEQQKTSAGDLQGSQT
jgi:GxxExxY protein